MSLLLLELIKMFCYLKKRKKKKKKVRMNIVQCRPESLGGEIDNCFREGVYLKDGKAE